MRARSCGLRDRKGHREGPFSGHDYACSFQSLRFELGLNLSTDSAPPYTNCVVCEYSAELVPDALCDHRCALATRACEKDVPVDCLERWEKCQYDSDRSLVVEPFPLLHLGGVDAVDLDSRVEDDSVSVADGLACSRDEPGAGEQPAFEVPPVERGPSLNDEHTDLGHEVIQIPRCHPSPARAALESRGVLRLHELERLLQTTGYIAARVGCERRRGLLHGGDEPSRT